MTTEPTTGQGWSRTFFFDELSLIARRPLSLSLSLFKFARLIRIKLSLSLSIAQFDYPYPSSHHYRPGFIVSLSITQSSPGIKTRPPSKHDWLSETERHMQNGVDRKGMRGYKKKHTNTNIIITDCVVIQLSLLPISQRSPFIWVDLIDWRDTHTHTDDDSATLGLHI